MTKRIHVTIVGAPSDSGEMAISEICIRRLRKAACEDLGFVIHSYNSPIAALKVLAMGIGEKRLMFLSGLHRVKAAQIAAENHDVRVVLLTSAPSQEDDNFVIPAVGKPWPTGRVFGFHKSQETYDKLVEILR